MRLLIILFLVLTLFGLSGPLAAQDEPFATNTPGVEEPPVGDEQPDVLTRLLTLLADKGVEVAIVISFLVLALRTKNLIEPAEVQNLAERLFKIAKEVTDAVPGTLDDAAREVIEEMVRRVIREELSKTPPPSSSLN